MQIKVISATKAIIESPSPEDLNDLRTLLTYTNTSIQHLIKRHYNNRFFKSKNPIAWAARLEELKIDLKKTLLFQEDGQYFIRPGSLPYLSHIRNENVTSVVKYATPKKIPWAKPLPFELYHYQQESVEKLLAAKHANVELCTGAGKSAILLKLCRETGFRCAIVAPSRSIFNELVEKFEHHLGKNNVGKFGDGKKKIGKRITICIGDSVGNIEKDTEEWDFFSNLDMMAVDESHTWGAETLETICHGVFANVPYRFFLSGTQTRGDGSEKLLQSIIGKTVHSLSTKDAVAGGFICPHEFHIVSLESSNPNYNSSDALDMKRIHFLSNKNILHFVAKLANADAQVNKRQTLILVEELSQIAALLPLMKVPTAIAHSESGLEKLKKLGLTKADPKDSVERFNKNEVQVLIGTSCIATGTNIFPTHNTVNWVGGASEVKTKQGSIGRSVRHLSSNPWAKNCVPKPLARIWDFTVFDIDLMVKHSETRLEYYKESGSAIHNVSLKR